MGSAGKMIRAWHYTFAKTHRSIQHKQWNQQGQNEKVNTSKQYQE